VKIWREYDQWSTVVCVTIPLLFDQTRILLKKVLIKISGHLFGGVVMVKMKLKLVETIQTQDDQLQLIGLIWSL
jgi:hypothetical protein